MIALRLSVFVAVMVAASANAQGLDCAALRSGDQPFEIAYAQVPLSQDAPPLYAEQTFRSADGTVRRVRRPTAQPGALLVSHLRFAFGQRFEAHGPGGTTVSEIAYDGIDFTSDPFATRRNLACTRRLRTAGQPERVERAGAQFVGEEAVAVGGCWFPVVVYEIERRPTDPRPGEPAITGERFWYAIDLRTLLRVSTSSPRALDVAAHRITTHVTPFR